MLIFCHYFDRINILHFFLHFPLREFEKKFSFDQERKMSSFDTHQLVHKQQNIHFPKYLSATLQNPNYPEICILVVFVHSFTPRVEKTKLHEFP